MWKIHQFLSSIKKTHTKNTGSFFSASRCINSGLYMLTSWWDQDHWVKKCMEYDVEGPRPRGRPKRTWKEVLEKDCQARKLNKEDAIDCSRWRKLVKDVWWSGWVWVGECFFWYWPTWVVPDTGPLNSCVLCIFYLLTLVCHREVGIGGMWCRTLLGNLLQQLRILAQSLNRLQQVTAEIQHVTERTLLRLKNTTCNIDMSVSIVDFIYIAHIRKPSNETITTPV